MKNTTKNAKGADRGRAQHKPALPDSIDRSIVAQLLKELEPSDLTFSYLSAADAERYRVAEATLEKLSDTEECELSEEEVDEAEDTADELATLARTTFVNRYAGHDAELLEALRILTTRRIIKARNAVYAEIERTGWKGDPKAVTGHTQQEKLLKRPRIGRDDPVFWDPKTHPVESMIVETFSPFGILGNLSRDRYWIDGVLSSNGRIQAEVMINALIADRWTLESTDRHPSVPTRHLPALHDITDATPYMFQASPLTDAFRIKQWSRDKSNGHVVGAVGNASVNIRAGEKLGPEEMDVLVMSCAILARCNNWRQTQIGKTNRLAEISIEDYAKRRGVTDYKHASKQLQAAAENLAGTAFDVSKHPFTYHAGKGGKLRKRRASFDKVWPIEHAWEENGKLYVQYTETFVFYMANSFLSRFPLQEYMRLRGQNTRGDDKASRNPNAAGLLFNVWPHIFQQLQGAECLCDAIFSVPTLISYCPEIHDPDDPMLTTAQKNNRKANFVTPLCAALDACEELFSWEWCGPGGAELDAAIMTKADAHQWRIVKDLYVKIRPYPQYSPVALPEDKMSGK